jgi:hypothetical protein
MKRTQLYLDDDLWQTLRVRAKQSGSTVSELVRDALRKTFLDSSANRERVLRSVVGLWKDRTDLGSTEEYVRSLRKDTRMDRLK